MHIRAFTLPLAVALAAFAAPAIAQDADAVPPAATDAPLPPPAEDRPFSGLYVGAAGGYDVQPNDVGERINFNRAGANVITNAAGADAFSPGFCNGRARGATNEPGCTNDRDDWAYYGRVGFDVQGGAFVFGGVAEFGKTEITDSVTAFSTTPASYTLTRAIDWELGLRGRAGFAARKTLFYGTGGAGYARIKNRFATTNTANAFAVSGARQRWGYQVGGGIEQKIGRHFSIGLEYLYHNYDNTGGSVTVTQGTAPATNPFVLNGAANTVFTRSDDTFEWHSLRATLGFRF